MDTEIKLIGPRRQDDMKPLWDAALTIEHESRFGGSDQARTVFLQNRPQDGRHWPAARLVRCRIDTLTVRLPGRGELVLSLTGNTGGVVSLMIQNPGDGDPSTVAYLLHGDIPLDLVWHEQEWAAHPPVIAGFSDVAFIRLTADGLSFAATGTVPWVDTPLAARYLLRCPFDSKGIGLKDYEVRIDLRDPAPDRFVPPENTLATFAAVFQKLRSFLARTEIAAPAWQELLLSSESIPPFSWRLSGTKAEFHLDAGALQLHLSDRPASIEPGGKYPRQVSAIECKWRVTRDKGLGTLRIEALGPTPNGPRATWNWSPKDGDSISLQEVLAADDALQTALFVRQGLGTRRPDPPSSEQLRRVYRAPVLYAFMPIEDGWTQWPVPNLVREDYASTGSKIVAPATSHSAISGAIVYQSIPGPDLASAQNPWKISVLRADQIANSSAWEIDLLSSPAAVKSASTCLLAPTLELDGFLWLSARRPTVEDAIPDLADHLRHLRSVPIRSGVVTDYPGAFTITIKELKVTFPKPSKEATPSIALWEMSLGANALFAVRAKPFVDVYGSVEVLPPLRLQRHPSLPFVQCLPLFQLQDPASYPAASRELAVFNRDWNTKFDNEGWIPTKRAWRFKFWGTGWPKAEGTDPVVPDWDPSLPLGSLSLPGLTIGPQQNAALPSAALGLSAQYWHGLPYLDQVHAFSQLPPKDDDDDGERQDPAGKTTGTARNRRQLDRNSLGDWWRDLSSRQFFARIESAECLSGTKGALKVDTLIEPYPWPVDATLDESYPGQFTLTDLDTKVAMPLKRELALRGLHGSFSAAASTIKLNNTVIEPASDFPVVAGSMISATQSGRKFIQDQRGLSRRSSTVVRDHGFDSYIDTPLEYRGKSYIQRTLLKPLTLQCADKTWRLLIAGVVLSDGILFERSAAQSAVAEDVNDPAARGADYSFLAGYSWWLDDGSAKTSLKLCGLDLFPLALDRVEFKVSGEVEIRLMARLQLPTFTPRSDKSLEQTQRSNAVVLTFKGPVGYDLQLDSIVPAPASGAPTPAGEWPLNADETGPLISWNQISYAGGKITVAEGRLEFGLFGQNWEIALPSIVFEAGKEALFVADVGYANVGIEVLKATGALRQGGDHNIELRTRFHWGDDLRLSLELGFPLRSGSTVAQPTCTFGSAGGAIPLECSPQITPNLGIQSTLSFGGKLPASVQLLPGMAFAAEDIVRAVTSGFAAAVFTAGEAKPYGDHLIPVLTTTAGSAELILPMQWGSALQDAEIGKKAASSLVFSSSAGDLVVNYSAQLATGAWKAQLLLSGWIEVKNLISWPESIVSAPDPGDLAGVSAFELYFPEGDDHLPAGSEEVFKNIGEQLATNRYWVRIEGHASDTGSARSNFTISQRRAGAVEYGLRLFVQTNYKSDAGWMLRKIEAHKAYGENRLAVLAYDADARKANRRVTIHLYPVSVRLPVATETLNHDRHTARILFNQHVLDAALTTAAPVGSNIIASLGDKPWNTTAVVQHEIVRVRDLTQKDALLSGRRRWTVAQEIRLASPQTLAAALDDLSGDKVQDPMSASSVGVGTAFQWTLSSNWLNKAGGGNALRALTPGLILEASVPVWLRIPASDQDGLSPADPCILQYLPTGTMRGSLLDPSDFRDARQGKRPWLFLSLPFLGRLQPADQDNSKLSVLNMDPVQTVMALGSSAGEVVLGLVSRRPVRPVWAYLHRFEGADHRRFERLTESVLEEGLRRYLHPAGETVAAEGGFAPVMATVPESNSGLVTRPTALAAAFVPRRTQYPVEAKVQSDHRFVAILLLSGAAHP
jgi:outer membrane protein OmpA-like peptidoglycan-associated protein